jgi:hypothetical protein
MPPACTEVPATATRGRPATSGRGLGQQTARAVVSRREATSVTSSPRSLQCSAVLEGVSQRASYMATRLRSRPQITSAPRQHPEKAASVCLAKPPSRRRRRSGSSVRPTSRSQGQARVTGSMWRRGSSCSGA